MTLQLVESENVGGLHAAIADRLAAEDEARREWLNRMVHGGGRCRYCGAKVSDRSMDRAPGVCGHPNCQRKGRRDAAEARKLIHDDGPARPAKGEDMPKGYARGSACKTCGSTGPKHRVPCAEDTGGGVPVKAEKAKAPEGRLAKLRQAAGRATTKVEGETVKGPDLAGYTVTQLLAIIVAAQAELDRREQDLQEQLQAIRTSRAA